jgi:hypothetical protein
MKSTNNSSLPQCPSIPEGLIEWLESLYQPVTNTLDHDIRTLDFKSGQQDIVVYLRSQSNKQTRS